MRLQIDTTSRTSYEPYYRIGSINIPSRYFLAPINTGFAVKGNPAAELVKFHEKRSGKGIGISYVGNVATEPKYTTNINTPWFTDDISSWLELSTIIRNNGSVPGIQIGCRASRLTPPKKWINRDLESVVNNIRRELDEFTEDDLAAIIASFISSAEQSIKAGFPVIQIHAAHGYLLAQFLNPILNRRQDNFGSDPALLLSLIISLVREKIPDIVLDVRLSLFDGIEPREYELQHKRILIEKLVSLGVDIISISAGTYDINKQLIYPLKQWGHGVYIADVIPFAKQYPHILWNVAGNIWDLRMLKDLPLNLTLSIGRSLIADPHFVEKSLAGNYESIFPCARNGHCHYYSRGTEHISCPVSLDIRQSP
jgi:2,4-dienoyl-CoA reductase-like NADH-dependent reductase (Old Yellow Enzyme family)